MNFGELETRLLERLRQKLQRGELSERRLARQSGYTQPHVHNVLKRVRRLNTDLADALLASLDASVEDLLGPETSAEAPGTPAYAPLWHGLLGRRHPFPEPGSPGRGLPFPPWLLSRLAEPILVCLAPEEDSMSPLLEPGDLVLVDRAEAARRRPVFESVSVLCWGGRGFLCRCQRAGGALVLVTDNGRGKPGLPDYLPLGKQDPAEIVVGRVAWAAREFPPG